MLPTEITTLWVPGWAVSRGTPPPVPTEWGYRIDVGAENQPVRHVVLDPDESTMRPMLATIDTPKTWLKAPVAPTVLTPWLDQSWTEDSPGWLMATDVQPTPVRPPDGYRVTTNTTAGVTRIHILTNDGTEAARGQLGHAGPTGTIDQITTDPAHRRRGLGTVVMAALANAAHEAGETISVLGATVEGRALYEALGWKMHAPLAGFIFQG